MNTSSQRRIVLITGANKGIGRETAAQLARRGLKVLVGARDRGRGLAAVEKLRAESATHDVHLVELDVTDDASVARAAEVIEAEHGGLDVLVNNAGIATGSSAPSEQDVAMMRAIYATNVFGLVAVTRAMLPLLRRSKAARIVNVTSSLASLATAPRRTAAMPHQNQAFGYSSSKSAVNHFTVRLAIELQDARILVNSACPGYVATDLNGFRGPRTVEQGAKIIVRLATLPEDGPTGGCFDDDGVVEW